MSKLWKISTDYKGQGTQYDEWYGFVVCADSEEEALAFVTEEIGLTRSKFFAPETVRVIEVLDGNTPKGIVMGDYNAG